ncbi:MAG: hypothetical protein AABX03_01250 [Nanoarchaeota archaeon]
MRPRRKDPFGEAEDPFAGATLTQRDGKGEIYHIRGFVANPINEESEPFFIVTNGSITHEQYLKLSELRAYMVSWHSMSSRQNLWAVYQRYVKRA